MPLIIAILTTILSAYFFYIGWPVLAVICIIFAIGLFQAVKPKRSIGFDDLVPSQHTTDKKRDKR